MDEGLFRDSAGRIVSTLVRILGSRHLQLAEECAQDAMVRALETWPFHGIPENPRAWLLQAARNRAIDILRREKRFVDAPLPAELQAQAQQELGIDDELGMMLLCCHPALGREAQVALTLKTVGGMSVREIARAYLVPDATIAQRLVRAKRQIAEQNLPFDLPQAIADIHSRLDAVLEVLYLLFNEGYTLVAPEFSNEAIRLAGILVANPTTALPECHALLALMLLQSVRDETRLDAEGSLVLLRDQDRSRWNRERLAQGLRHLDLASHGQRLTRYHIEAGIASQHGIAASWDSTDWRAIERAYEMLAQIHPSPVVTLNRTIARGMSLGPEAALDALENLERELEGYLPYHAACGFFAKALGNRARASEAYSRALALSRTAAERTYLLAQLG